MTKSFSQELTVVVGKLHALRIPWGVFAGAAASAYGSHRPIKDIDILIPSDKGNQVANHFPHAKLICDSDGRIAMLQSSRIEIIAGLKEKICLEMDTEMISRLQNGSILEVDVPLLSLEDNLVFKAVLGRGSEIGKHDWEDIADMLAFAEAIDWDYVEWRLQRCAPANPRAILKRLQWIRTG